MEIVSQLEIADVIFRRKRSNDRKYVCGSQAKVTPEFFWISDMFHLRVVDITDTLTRKLERRRKETRLNSVAPLSTGLNFEDNPN